MGKLGGRELNYASDIDVMFVGDGRGRARRRLIEVARTCFRVDADLRPEGRDGPLVRSLESFEAYWDRWAQTWEFQALLKARPVAGDTDLGAAFLDRRARAAVGAAVHADDLRSVRAMKAAVRGRSSPQGPRATARSSAAAVASATSSSPCSSCSWCTAAPTPPCVRRPRSTRSAELDRAGYVAADDARALASAYRFLRTVEHRLQLVDEQQVHAFPTDAAARTRLARVLGLPGHARSDALEQLDDALRRHQADGALHPRAAVLPAAARGARGCGATTLARTTRQARLAAFGFTDAERTRQAVRS